MLCSCFCLNLFDFWLRFFVYNHVSLFMLISLRFCCPANLLHACFVLLKFVKFAANLHLSSSFINHFDKYHLTIRCNKIYHLMHSIGEIVNGFVLHSHCPSFCFCMSSIHACLFTRVSPVFGIILTFLLCVFTS